NSFNSEIRRTNHRRGNTLKGPSHTWDVLMPIKLDWRFDALHHLARAHIKELWDFYDQAQKHFQTAMKAWEDEGKDLNEEEEAMYADYFIEKRDSIESLLDRGHTLGVAAVYTFLERFLNLVL